MSLGITPRGDVPLVPLWRVDSLRCHFMGSDDGLPSSLNFFDNHHVAICVSPRHERPALRTHADQLPLANRCGPSVSAYAMGALNKRSFERKEELRFDVILDGILPIKVLGT
jgi:hypothetical protein